MPNNLLTFSDCMNRQRKPGSLSAALHGMAKFGLILVLLLPTSLSQDDPEPIFKAVGETLELGFCFGVDYITVYRINDREHQLLWNSSNSASTPDAYKNRINASDTWTNELTGLQIRDLRLSDSGLHLRECWAQGQRINHRTNFLYVCEEESPPQEVFLQNGGAVLSCDISYSEHDTTSIKWFKDVNDGHKTALFLDTERSQEPLQEELKNVFQVQDKGFSLYISQDVLGHNHNFVCLVMKKGQCKSFKNIYLPDSSKPEMQFVYYAVGEKAMLSCVSEHLDEQKNYWNTPFGEIDSTTQLSHMYISNSEGTKDYVLVIPSITNSHSGEYVCVSKLAEVEYYVTVCSKLVSNNVQEVDNGGQVTLACTLTKNESVNILWYRQRDHMELKLIYDSGDPSIDIPADMMGRTHILDSNGELRITELNENDSGAYWCVVLLDSIEQDFDYEDEEDDQVDDEWAEEEENTETCVFKSVTQLKIQPQNTKNSNGDLNRNSLSESESSPVPFAIIGGVVGIVILGIIAVVVWKIRAKKRDLRSSSGEREQQKEASAVSSPLMSL